MWTRWASYIPFAGIRAMPTRKARELQKYLSWLHLQADLLLAHLGALVFEVQGIEQVHGPHRDECVDDYHWHSHANASECHCNQ